MRVCDICGRKIKSSGESITTINNKTYCSECSKSKKVQAEIKSIKKQVNSIIGWTIGGIITNVQNIVRFLQVNF